MFRTCNSSFAGSTARLSYLLVLLLLACASQSRSKSVPVESQIYGDAIRQICDVDRLAGVTATSDELDRTQKRDEFIIEHTKNSDAIYFSTVWRTKPPGEKADLLEREAHQLGISRCLLAETLRTE